jgi:hypothetical protein
LKVLFFCLALLAPAGLAATEGTLTGADVYELRAVIQRQIDAFRRDDAHSAFALASPKVQQAFGSPERFLDTVRMAYRAVYRPASVAFLELIVMGGEVVQPVQLTERSGAVWVAYYGMQRQEDGAWRISGCHLVQPTRTISA